jgi:hypothetical protein
MTKFFAAIVTLLALTTYYVPYAVEFLSYFATFLKYAFRPRGHATRLRINFLAYR